METKLRQLKMERLAASAAGDELEAKRIQKKINEQQTIYRRFSEKHDLLYDTRRASVEGYRRISVKESAKILDNNLKSGTISTVIKEGTVKKVHLLGTINKEIYSCVTTDIATDEVIITDERIQHIKEHHPNDFEKYSEYLKSAVENPDYILEANKPDTAFVLKKIKEDNLNFQIIVKLSTSQDKKLKNSIITFLKISDKTWKKYLRNKKVLYKSE